MATELLSPVADLLKKLPGFGWYLTLVSVLYIKAVGRIELTGEGLLVLASAYITYRLGSWLDKPLYDALLGPRCRSLRVLTRWQSSLQNLRNGVARELFMHSGRPVNSYEEALAENLITVGGDTTLYKRCVYLLQPTKLWDQQVAQWLEISKATRALVVLLPILAVLFSFVHNERIAAARTNLGVLGIWWVLLLGAVAATLAFLGTRFLHHRRLYTDVQENVAHIRLADGRWRAEIILSPFIVG